MMTPPPPPPPTSSLKAIFFDLDDTLVPTSVYDVRAYGEVKESVNKFLEESKERYANASVVVDDDDHKMLIIDKEKFVSDFKQKFVQEPWDPEYKTDVFKWRSKVWEHALKLQIDTSSNNNNNNNNKRNNNSNKRSESIDVIIEDVGIKCQKCFDENRMGDFPLHEGVKELIEYIQTKGLQTCIITNGHHRVQRDKLEACNAYELFENIIVGGEEVLSGREEKPSEGIFIKACKYVGCLPSEAIHVGDSLGADIQGGINAGLLATVFINVKKIDVSTVTPTPSYTISHVAELKEIIEKLLLL